MTPAPTTIAPSEVASARMPATFSSPAVLSRTMRSFGHLSWTATFAISLAASTSASDTAATARWRRGWRQFFAARSKKHREQERFPRRGLPPALEASAAGGLVVGDHDRTPGSPVFGVADQHGIGGGGLDQLDHLGEAGAGETGELVVT